ncbi:hypothetical protein HYC85_018768 [Camellia sinensis]|uniref:PPM-type phosphatase domain-containing protein n=1 Tax=Camellia sinensis TaxID=4442 RepID=A0A7J7GXJ1_CAMSI|nr:hypothetical protein HYC85_018768 [Camellia sinensis]
MKSRSDVGREAADALAKEARKNDLMLSSSGTVHGKRSDNFVSVFSKGGKKGVNKDCLVVWEEFECQEDMIICGIFDGHGPWGHLVAKRVRKLMPSSLLCNWQETLALNSLNLNSSTEPDKSLNRFNIWKQSYLKTCSAIDQDLDGTTALTIVRQLYYCPRAVLATTSDDGCLVPLRLTVDLDNKGKGVLFRRRGVVVINAVMGCINGPTARKANHEGWPTGRADHEEGADHEGWPSGKTDHEEGRPRRLRWRDVRLKRRRVTW